MAEAARRPRGSDVTIVVVVVVVAALAALLVWLSASSQELQQGQQSGRAQRTDQQQLTCALWAAMRSDVPGDLSAEVRAAADRICSDVPTPTSSPSR
ncbi:hypothetical protein [Streptomyces sp. NPDC006784]|uniref:hypothetical protein n=1 Tax=Streptomyces sp. NPDC006784 TaxID=3364764 RepID=UPI0036BB0BFD